MAEALAIIGLASNVAQFLELGIRLIRALKDQNHDREGAVNKRNELGLVAKSIRDNCRGIVIDHSAARLSDEELTIVELAKNCEGVANEIVTSIQTANSNATSRRPLRRIIAVIREPTSERKILELEDRMQRMYRHLRSTMSEALRRNNSTTVMAAILHLSRKNEALRVSFPNKLMKMQEDITRNIEASVEDVSYQLESLKHAIETTNIVQKTLESLFFESMDSRHSGIETSYPGTLAWVFDPSRTTFTHWLENEDGIYWISGLCGSGKSSLMKYVSSNGQTLEHLQNWSRPKKAVIACFYFWNAGDELLKSPVGLLRSLLYQILRTDPNLVSCICPNLHRKGFWTEDELIQTLKDLAKYMRPSAKLCFFIDGLDEFQGRQSSLLQPEKQILQLLHILLSCGNIKICASSRPWPVFESEFLDNSKLIVQEHTSGDMRRFVRGMFMESIEVRSLVKQDTRYNDLVDVVVSRGNGVWLWVFLVVRDLLRDISYEEDYSHLLNRIYAFPRLLTDYFRTMMERIDPIHREQTAQILVFLLSASDIHKIPLIALRFIEHLKNPRFPIDGEIETIDRELSLKICKAWKKRLHSRCGDLVQVLGGELEVWEDFCMWKIDFLHRSVRDFLQENYRDHLIQWLPPDFNAHISLSRLALALIKARSLSCYNCSISQQDADNDSQSETMLGVVADRKPFALLHDYLLTWTFLLSASDSEDLGQPLDPEFIEELNHINSLHSTAYAVNWAWGFLHSSSRFNCSLATLRTEKVSTVFLSVLASFRLMDYLQQRLEEPDVLSQRQKTQLLFFTLAKSMSNHFPYMSSSFHTIVKQLLAHGADPNLEIKFFINQNDIFFLDSPDVPDGDGETLNTMVNVIKFQKNQSKRFYISLSGTVWEHILIDCWYVQRQEFWYNRVSENLMFENLMMLAHHRPNTNLRFAYHHSDKLSYLVPLSFWKVCELLHSFDPYELGERDVIRMILKPEQAQELFCVFDSVERERQRVLGGCEKVAS